MNVEERIEYAEALAGDPDITIRDYLEIMKEIEDIIRSFELYPINGCWQCLSERHTEKICSSENMLER